MSGLQFNLKTLLCIFTACIVAAFLFRLHRQWSAYDRFYPELILDHKLDASPEWSHYFEFAVQDHRRMLIVDQEEWTTFWTLNSDERPPLIDFESNVVYVSLTNGHGSIQLIGQKNGYGHIAYIGAAFDPGPLGQYQCRCWVVPRETARFAADDFTSMLEGSVRVRDKIRDRRGPNEK